MSSLPHLSPPSLLSFPSQQLQMREHLQLGFCLSDYLYVRFQSSLSLRVEGKPNSKLLVSLSPLSLLDLRYIEDSRIYWPLCRLSGRLKLKKQFLTTKSNRLVKKNCTNIIRLSGISKVLGGLLHRPSTFSCCFYISEILWTVSQDNCY